MSPARRSRESGHVKFSVEDQKLLRRDGVDASTLRVLEKTEEARKLKADLDRREREFEAAIAERDSEIREMQTAGVQKIAIAGAVGFGVGGGLAYILHDEVATQFGKGTPLALGLLPAVGLALLAGTKKIFKPSKKVDTSQARAGSYGAALGLVLVGGFLSYEDYQASLPTTV
jgi:hypothetical protein